jgi:myo-inositol 2-dehydrogenase / D-chiro-inositol 1-dehydrogenase
LLQLQPGAVIVSHLKPTSVDRRRFLKGSAAAASSLALAQAVHAGGNSQLRIGLIGCGGRGTGAATQALRADREVRLVAMADAFEDKVNSSLNQLMSDATIRQKIDVPAERRFHGFDAYQRVIDNVDVVLLCTPPGFRPIHLEAAVRARKHIFCEKPMAVDGPGVRRVIAAADQQRQNRLALVSGFCWRYHNGMRETVRRIHDGSVGNIVALQCTYNTQPVWYRERQPGMTEMQYQVHNWYNFTWLSGDFNVEQHCHSIDKMGWVMRNTYPVKCVGLGGRQQRSGPSSGHIFDHMSVVYEFADGIKCFSSCRQMTGCANDVSDYIMGTQGTAVLSHSTTSQMCRIINGPNRWSASPRDREDDMYQHEHNELFASIRRGEPINDGDWMAKSTLMAIMGRMACYTGREITWDQALNSQQDLSPPSYRWDQPMPEPEVARPGITRFS